MSIAEIGKEAVLQYGTGNLGLAAIGSKVASDIYKDFDGSIAKAAYARTILVATAAIFGAVTLICIYEYNYKVDIQLWMVAGLTLSVATIALTGGACLWKVLADSKKLIQQLNTDLEEVDAKGVHLIGGCKGIAEKLKQLHESQKRVLKIQDETIANNNRILESMSRTERELRDMKEEYETRVPSPESQEYDAIREKVKVITQS